MDLKVHQFGAYAYIANIRPLGNGRLAAEVIVFHAARPLRGAQSFRTDATYGSADEADQFIKEFAESIIRGDVGHLRV